jgi:alpha-tubulin suppressor-like RCC1 family protein
VKCKAYLTGAIDPAVGNNSYSQLNVRVWSDIVQVAAGDSHTVGLKSDGTVVAVGFNSCDHSSLHDWKLLSSENKPPTAICQNVTMKTDPGTCTAAESVENSSYDPDEDFIIFEQTPAGAPTR